MKMGDEVRHVEARLAVLTELAMTPQAKRVGL